MMTSSKGTLGQNRAQLAAGCSGFAAAAAQSRARGACDRAAPRLWSGAGQGAASPELAGVAAFCELVLCPERANPAHARLIRADCACVRDGCPKAAAPAPCPQRPAPRPRPPPPCSRRTPARPPPWSRRPPPTPRPRLRGRDDRPPPWPRRPPRSWVTGRESPVGA